MQGPQIGGTRVQFSRVRVREVARTLYSVTAEMV
jgi:hypothetical protein